VDLRGIFIVGLHTRCSGVDHTVLPANYAVPASASCIGWDVFTAACLASLACCLCS